MFYNFNTIKGGDHTLGLLYGSFTFNFFKLSLGYDSDKIRTYFQNGMHKIMNNDMVPRIGRNDKIYFDITLFGNNGQW